MGLPYNNSVTVFGRFLSGEDRRGWLCRRAPMLLPQRQSSVLRVEADTSLSLFCICYSVRSVY
jgi:hypothetical protein